MYRYFDVSRYRNFFMWCPTLIAKRYVVVKHTCRPSEMITDDGRFEVSSSRTVSKKQPQRHKVAEEVAVTSAAATSSLGSQEPPPPGGKEVPPPIAAVDTRDVQLWSEEMLGDDLYGRKQRVLILMSDTGGGHRASAEVRQPVTVYTKDRYSSSGLSSSRHVLHLADRKEKLVWCPSGFFNSLLDRA